MYKLNLSRGRVLTVIHAHSEITVLIHGADQAEYLRIGRYTIINVAFWRRSYDHTAKPFKGRRLISTGKRSGEESAHPVDPDILSVDPLAPRPSKQRNDWRDLFGLSKALLGMQPFDELDHLVRLAFAEQIRVGGPR